MQKRFAIPSEKIEPLAEGYGGCFATGMITVDNRGIGYMYREVPDNETDSGWRFFSGHESQEYVDDATNTMVYNVNTIANYSPDIVTLLDASVGSAFERDELGRLSPVDTD